jgi:hypothetical protein
MNIADLEPNVVILSRPALARAPPGATQKIAHYQEEARRVAAEGGHHAKDYRPHEHRISLRD